MTTQPRIVPIMAAHAWEEVSKFYESSKISSPYAPPALAKFTLFPALLSEIRLQIWQHAISVPRTIELVNRFPLSDRSRPELDPIYAGYNYMSKDGPPPLLATCSESRKETLKAYQNDLSVETPLWIRFDYDIVLLKDLIFSADNSPFHRPTRNRNLPMPSPKSDNWIGGPPLFTNIQCLAINAEQPRNDGLSSIIRHFFPNLRLLIVLIDDEYDIDEIWDIEGGDYEDYECAEPQGVWHRPRENFVEATTGPFFDVRNSVGYKNFLENMLSSGFENERYEYAGYRPPYVLIMGASLNPASLEDDEKAISQDGIGDGRWPIPLYILDRGKESDPNWDTSLDEERDTSRDFSHPLTGEMIVGKPERIASRECSPVRLINAKVNEERNPPMENKNHRLGDFRRRMQVQELREEARTRALSEIPWWWGKIFSRNAPRPAISNS